MEQAVKPYANGRGWTLYHGDCLNVVPQLPRGLIDAVVTDPPYSSGGQFRGDRTQKTAAKYVQSSSFDTCRDEFSGDNRDQRAFLAWSTMWLGQLHQAAKPGAVVMCFTDWRQLPTITDAIQCGGWVWRNIATWWKPGIRMQAGRFSSSSEFVVYGSRGIPNPGAMSPQNVAAIQPVSGEDKEHIAEKPQAVMEWVLGATPEISTVIDPFAGSGTTGAACIASNRRFIGIEIDERYCEVAARRLQRAEEDTALFAQAEAEHKQLELGDPS